jgi:hypothetical protein
MMQTRRTIMNVLLLGALLTQAYVVDAYVKVETGRLNWQRHNQNTLRADLYRGIQDAVTAGDTDANASGRRVILSSGFVGGPRYMRQLYQDAMAVVARFGKPDLFITFTCNPKWPEIEAELLPGQQAVDRPDLVARVFRRKVCALVDDIVRLQKFGNVVAYSYVIEFQKRGLPHMHMLVTLRDKPDTAEDVDRIVCAELPDPETEPELHAKVARHMMHGPCGSLKRDAQCMQENACTKNYPKPFVRETVTDGPGGYPVYRRRDDGRTVTRSGRLLDNRWVVPYNRALLARYDAHINVEVATGVAVVKYLYKYITKGHDRGLLRMGGENAPDAREHDDEIQNFVDGRYVSGAEAAWRLYHFPMAETLPNVVRLQIHLEGEHTVVYAQGADLRDVERAGADKLTTLTAWFKLNADRPNLAPNVLYADMPHRFVFLNGAWCERRRWPSFPSVGRIYYVTPGSGEKYYLRLLLGHVTGATCYEDVRTVDGVVHNTFREAAMARGLLRGDDEWDRAMREATAWQMPSQLRSLFVSILVFCTPDDPNTLWSAHLLAMSEDFLRTAQRTDPERQPGGEEEAGAALRDIEAQLKTHRKTLSDFGLPPAPPPPGGAQNAASAVQVELRRWNQDELRARVEQETPLLNAEQRAAFDAVRQALQPEGEDAPMVDARDHGRFFFLDAMGGCGKTFVLGLLLCYVRMTGDIAVACATSGLAALLLEGGSTAHSRFKLPLDMDSTSVSNMNTTGEEAALLRVAKLIVWDEAPMAHKHAVEVLDRLLRDIMGTPNVPFGGKVVVLSGDYRQLLPVVPRGTRNLIVAATHPNSYLWRHVRVLRLHVNMRVQRLLAEGRPAAAQQAWAAWLQQLGEGTLPSSSDGSVALPPECCMGADLPEGAAAPTLMDFIQRVYGDLANDPSARDPEVITRRAILTPLNKTVDEINEQVMRIWPGEERTFFSVDEFEDDEAEGAQMFPTEVLNSFNSGSIPPHRLTLKVGAPVMLLRNMCPAKGLMNGTRLVIVRLSARIIQVRILSGPCAGQDAIIPRIPMRPSDGNNVPVVFTRTQFPVRPAFAMTINKAQGQTLEAVGTYLPQPVFTHGQLYVAASRVGDPSQCSFFVLKQPLPGAPPPPPVVSTATTTKNVVYAEVVL